MLKWPTTARDHDIAMSAFGPKRTSLVAPHMSAFGGKADMAIAMRGTEN